ncbi:MAG: hypothetical protein AB7Y46_12185 [Armatimonadota bacterium]
MRSAWHCAVLGATVLGLLFIGLSRHDWPGVLGGPLHVAAALLVGLWVLRAYLARRPDVLYAMAESLPNRQDGRHSPAGLRSFSGWPWVGLGVMVLAGVYLELSDPYYFTQDDNLVELLPNMLHGCRCVFAGAFPAWNPYQFLGMPLAETGTCALTYPLTWLSYATATWALGNEFLTIEVFCSLHLLTAFAATYWLGRRLGISPALSSALAVCFALSGFALIGGRSWYMTTPTFAWTPLLLRLMLEVGDRRLGWAWVAAVALVVGLLFHAGHAQMWLYSVGYAALWVLYRWASGRSRGREVLRAGGAALLGTGIAALLLVPQFLATRSYGASTYGGVGTLLGLDAILLPYPLAQAEHPAGWGNVGTQFMGHLYYAGTVLTLGWVLALAVACIHARGLGLLLRSPLVPLSLLALVLSFGDDGVLWRLQHDLPVLSSLRGAFRHLVYFHLFALTAGASIIDCLASRLAALALLRRLAALAAMGLMLYHATQAHTAFYTYAQDPYPALPPALARLAAQPETTRILPLAVARSGTSDYLVNLVHGLPSVYGISSLAGYEPQVQRRPEWRRLLAEYRRAPLQTLREHGVTHIVLHDSLGPAGWARSEFYSGEVLAALDDLELTPLAADARLYALPAARPRAFAVGRPDEALAVRVLPASVEVDVSATEGQVIVNYLYRPRIRAQTDLGPAACHSDAHGRIAVTIPAGARRIEVTYSYPWGAAAVSAAAMAAAGLLACALAGAGDRREAQVSWR